MTMDEDQAMMEDVEVQEKNNQEDASAVISAYFEEKGLVRQQLDSFEVFIQNTMQEIVDEFADIEIPLKIRHNPRHQSDFFETIYRISFGQIYLSKPMMRESHGETATLFPKAAMLKNITYSAALYVDVSKRVIKKRRNSEEVIGSLDLGKVFIGKVPIMLRSSYCTLYRKSKTELTELGECPFDQGGYFIINGKVRIAEEKMSTNHVHVFKTRQPNRYSHVAEVWSTAESQNRPPSTMFVRMLSRAGAKEGALDYIGRYGATVGETREERIKCARDILQHEMLPDVGVGEFCEATKAYYFGYIIQRLILCALGRGPEDDRDHNGNKRLHLAGPLLGGQFRMLFRKLTRDVRSYAQESVDNGRDVNLQVAIKAKTITRGLECSLATGNWLQAYGARTSARVSQADDAKIEDEFASKYSSSLPESQGEVDGEAGSHTTAVVGIAMRSLSTVVLCADSQASEIVEANGRLVEKVTKDTQKIERFGGRFLIAYSGNAEFCHLLVERRLSRLVYPRNLNRCIRLIRRTMEGFRGYFLRMKKRAREPCGDPSVISALVAAVGVNADGESEGRLWIIDDDWMCASEVRWGACGSGEDYAAAELKKRVKLVRDVEDAAELCIRSVYRASLIDDNVGGDMNVAQMTSPSPDGPGRVGVTWIYAPEEVAEKFYSRDGRVNLQGVIDNDELLPAQRKDKRAELIQDLIRRSGRFEEI
ncbi:DNA-directed RNA polymerase II subunit 2 [Linum grandiflorum]